LKIRSLLASVIIFALSCQLAGNSSAAVLKIMPLGDSITLGANSPAISGYRGPLYTLLSNAGITFQYVGSSMENAGTLPATPIDERHHEGHSGFFISADPVLFPYRGGITNNLNAWLLPGIKPDIILLMIGTNDVDNNYDLPNAPSRLSNLISMISDKTTGLKPNAQLIVATIIPINDTTENGWVQTYNSSLATVVSNHQKAGENVSMVDMYSAISTSSDLYDKLHPNDSGYNKMAQVWYDGIVAIVPEPSSIVLLSTLGLCGLAITLRRLRRG
jgi:hypothetical protein